MKKIFIIGSASIFGMERSYKIALEQLGYEVEIIDFNSLVNFYFPIKFLKKIGTYVEFTPAVVKANHFVSKKVFKEKPISVIVFTHVKIYPGTIEYFKIVCKNVFFYWPDSIVNMTESVFFNLKHYSKVYAHSLENVSIFKNHKINSKWLPFAGDTLATKIFTIDNKIEKEFDFSFVGAFRPERFEAINEIIKNFPNSKILVVGLGWKKVSFFNKTNLHIEDKMVDINEFLEFTSKSKVALNAIDHLNYPSSNLRFFEIGLSGVPQISTEVPEFENVYEDKKYVFYYKHLSQLIENAHWILTNYEAASAAAINFRNSIDTENNYLARSQSLIDDFV